MQLRFFDSASPSHSVSLQGGGGEWGSEKKRANNHFNSEFPGFSWLRLDAPRAFVCTGSHEELAERSGTSSVPGFHEPLLRAFCILLETMLFIMSITASHLSRETNKETWQLKSKADSLPNWLPIPACKLACSQPLRNLLVARRVMGRERGGGGMPLGWVPSG